MNETASVPPFWLAGLALLLVLVIMAEFPRIGAALLGVLLLVLLLNARQKGIV